MAANRLLPYRRDLEQKRAKNPCVALREKAMGHPKLIEDDQDTATPTFGIRNYKTWFVDPSPHLHALPLRSESGLRFKPMVPVAKCQTRTSATLHSITSSARASRGRRHIEAERPGGLEVDDQLEPRRLYHGQICGLRAVENPAGVGANLPICVDEAVLDRLIAAGGDDWNRRGRWREALKDGLVGGASVQRHSR